MATTWTYGDWKTTTTAGSQARLTRLDLHIKEVADELLTVRQTYPGGRSDQFASLDNYLSSLREDAKALETALARSNGSKIGFSRGRAIP